MSTIRPEDKPEKRMEVIAAETAKLYDSVVDDYVSTFFEDRTDAPWLNDFCERVSVGGHILDVGCGPGNFAAYLVSKGFSVTGIDISKKMIERARELVPDATFQVMNCAHLELQGDTFDGVLIAYSLLHLPRADALKSLAECVRVMRQGGILCLMLKEGQGEHSCPAALAPGKQCFVQLWPQDEARAALDVVGLAVLHTETGTPTAEKELQFRKLLFIARKK